MYTKQNRNQYGLKNWLTTLRADYLHHILSNADKIRTENILFFDVEFSSRSWRYPEPKLVVWHETKAPKGHRKYNIVWHNDESGKKKLIEAMYRARYIVGYHSIDKDFDALQRWGLDDRKVLLKLIDVYDFIFWGLSKRGKGSLDYISRLNDGPGKYLRKDSTKEEFQKQCQRDVKILEYIFWKVLDGKLHTPRFSTFDAREVWPDLQIKKILKSGFRSRNGGHGSFLYNGGIYN